MLRIQILLATTVLGLLLSLAGLAAYRLVTDLGAAHAVAVVVAASFVALRLLAPFRGPPEQAMPVDALDRSLALLHVAAIARLLWPPELLPLPDRNLALALTATLPLLVALASELALVACLQALAPSIRAALAADVAVAQWFAKRRIDVERELLESLSQQAAGDARLRHRLERLTRRFDRQLADLAPPADPETSPSQREPLP
jgi:hypothetical protein